MRLYSAAAKKRAAHIGGRLVRYVGKTAAPHRFLSRIFLTALFAAVLCTAVRHALPAAALEAGDDGVYIIATSADLIAFRDAVNAGSGGISAKLTADIDLSSGGRPIEWEPIGNPTYNGKFDGGGHTVSGYVVTEAAWNGETYNGSKIYYAGFFSGIGDANKTGEVRNLVLRGSVSLSDDYNGYLRAGGICGLLYGSDTSRSSISNCVHFGAVYSPYYKNARLGGFIGYNDGGVITNCFHSGDVYTEPSGDASDMGGFAGSSSKAGNILNCGWQSGGGSGENYVKNGVGGTSSAAEVATLDYQIAAPPIATALSASIEKASIDTDEVTTVTITTAPGTPANAGEYIADAHVAEDSYDRAVIEVSERGGLTFTITPVAAGETSVTFVAKLRPTDFSKLPDFVPSSDDGLTNEMSMTVSVKVTEKAAAEDIRVVPASADMTVGERLALAVFSGETRLEDGVSWASGSEMCARIDAGGVVTALAEGTAVITACAGEEKTARCFINVSPTDDEKPVSDDVPPRPEAPGGTDQPDAPSSSGGGCSAGFGAPLLIAAVLLVVCRRR